MRFSGNEMESPRGRVLHNEWTLFHGDAFLSCLNYRSRWGWVTSLTWPRRFRSRESEVRGQPTGWGRGSAIKGNENKQNETKMKRTAMQNVFISLW